uniref:Uncharacterized protein n=1 Tax=Arundo donax TaxID=35708 RepID=A0A0A9ANZ7_ARUDO
MSTPLEADRTSSIDWLISSRRPASASWRAAPLRPPPWRHPPGGSTRSPGPAPTPSPPPPQPPYSRPSCPWRAWPPLPPPSSRRPSARRPLPWPRPQSTPSFV